MAVSASVSESVDGGLRIRVRIGIRIRYTQDWGMS